MKKYLVALTVFAFVLTLVYGSVLYKMYIPPFRQGTCLTFDYFELATGKREEGQMSLIVHAEVYYNFISAGESEMLLIFNVMPGVFMAQIERVPFYNLRLAKPAEVDCGFF
jgi:hypothetical protein